LIVIRQRIFLILLLNGNLQLFHHYSNGYANQCF
jgi:hypothetical protein